MATPTTNLRLLCPAHNERGWDVPINSALTTLDSQAPIAALAVTATESPSTTLGVRVTAGTYESATNTIGTYAGGTLTLAASSTVYLWLTDAGVLTTGSAWPAGNHVRLASVVTGTASITSIADARVTANSSGQSMVVPDATASYLLVSANATLPNARLLAGTANQVIVADGGPGGSLVLSLPQPIATTSSVTFAGLAVSGTGTLGSLSVTGSSTFGGTASFAALSTTGTATLSSLAVTTTATFTGPATLNSPTTIKGLRRNVATKTASYTVVGTDDVIRADATSAAITITLPAASTVGGMEVRIKKIDSSANTVTVSSSSSIDGASSLAITAQYTARTLIADATSNTWGIY